MELQKTIKDENMNSRISGLELALREAVEAGLHKVHRHALAEVYRSARKEYLRTVPVHEVSIDAMKEHCLLKARGYIERHKPYTPKGDDVA